MKAMGMVATNAPDRKKSSANVAANATTDTAPATAIRRARDGKSPTSPSSLSLTTLRGTLAAPTR